MRIKLSKALFLRFLFLPASCFLLCSVHNYTDYFARLHASGDFAHFTQEMFCHAAASSTLTLHYTLEHPEKYGISNTPVTFGRTDETSLILDSNASAQEYLKELSHIPVRCLSEAEQQTYDTLTLYLENEKDASNYNFYQEPLGATLGVQAQLPILLAEYRFCTEQDVENYLNLLARTDAYFTAILNYEAAKSARGLFMSDSTAASIIRQCQAFAHISLKQHFLVTTFEERLKELSSLNESQRQVYCSRNRSMLRHHVIPAYELLAEGLQKLKGTGQNDQGLCYFPQGRAYYEYLVRAQTGSWLPLAGIEKRIRTQLLGDIQRSRDILLAHPQLLQNASYDGLPSAPDEILRNLQAEMQSDFPAVSHVDYEIKYVDKALEAYLSPAFYLTPPIDDQNTNVIYINNGTAYSPLALYTTLAHEGYPGHLYQNTSSQFSRFPIRNLLNFGGFTEGWATYTEMESYRYAARTMSDENAKLITDLQKYQRSVSLAISSLVDIGVHYHGYSREEVAQLLEHLGFTDRAAATALYDAVIEAPANYLKYYLGCLTFRDLCTYCERSYPTKFDLRDFHRKILEIGPCPFPVLEKYIKAYYEELT
ncbi:MAG: DUF885 domain-containing protein [Eubacteriales bacterium]|nr:DUF885 domain-containing protein [Eubacteriales bacterium]